MTKKAFALALLITFSQSSPASARCFDEACAEGRISAFFFLLPVLIWGALFWFTEKEYSEADMRNDSESFPKNKRRKSRLTFLVTFVLVIVFMNWWEQFF